MRRKHYPHSQEVKDFLLALALGVTVLFIVFICLVVRDKPKVQQNQHIDFVS